jgi:DNA primase
MFDGDKAGSVAAQKLEVLLNENNFNAEVIELPESMDPGDLTEQDITTLMKGLYGNENSSS